MRMIRLMKLKHGLPCSLVSEAAVKNVALNATTEANWERAHMRMPFDDSDNEIHNDEVHEVKRGCA
jgi:hypothetical protein